MTNSKKALTFPTAGSAKSPQISQNLPPSTYKWKDTPKYLPVDRAWSTPSTPSSFLSQPKWQNMEDAKMPTYADAQYQTPMERWEKEDLRQNQWNNIASFVAPSKQIDHVSSKNMQAHRDNSSMTGNVGSKK